MGIARLTDIEPPQRKGLSLSELINKYPEDCFMMSRVSYRIVSEESVIMPNVQLKDMMLRLPEDGENTVTYLPARPVQIVYEQALKDLDDNIIPRLNLIRALVEAGLGLGGSLEFTNNQANLLYQLEQVDGAMASIFEQIEKYHFGR